MFAGWFPGLEMFELLALCQLTDLLLSVILSMAIELLQADFIDALIEWSILDWSRLLLYPQIKSTCKNNGTNERKDPKIYHTSIESESYKETAEPLLYL